MNELQQQVLQLIQAMFGASPGKKYLDEFTAQIDSGSISVTGLAVALAASPVFKANAYSDALDDTEFVTQFLNDILGNLVASADMAWASGELESMLASGLSRGEVIKIAAEALASVEISNASWGQAAAQFNNKVDVSGYFSIDTGMSAFSLQTLRQVTENVTNSTESVAAAKQEISATVDGVVHDGYVSGATVFIDIDGDGVRDANEPSTTSDTAGAFSFTSEQSVFAQLVADGGTDVATGKVFEGSLTAPAGSTVVNPLTTLTDEVAKLSGSITSAKQLVTTALGLASTTNLLKFDPIQQATAADASTESKAAALLFQTVVAQLNTIVSHSAAVLSGTASSNSEAAGIKATYAALAESFVASSATEGGTIDLTSSETIAAVVRSSAVKAGASSLEQSRVDGVANDTATVITNFTKAISSAVTNGGDNVVLTLNEIAAIQIVAEDLESRLLLGAFLGSVSDPVTNTSGDALITSIDNAKNKTGDVDGDGESDVDEGVEDNSGGDGSTIESFIVTESNGAVTFSGSATGAITISWTGAVGSSIATFTRGGVEASENPDFGGTAKTITLGSGESLSSSLQNLTALHASQTTIEGDGVIVLTDTSVAAGELNIADNAAALTINAVNANTLTGTAADILVAIGSSTTVLAGDFNATVTGTASAEYLSTIDDNTTGAITATLDESLEGVVVDGYVAGATVFVDQDGDGELDPGEPSTTTDSTGNFVFPDGVSNYGQIVTIGGTDIATGKPFEGSLTAPAGSTVVNPLTTLINEVSKSGGKTVSQAKQSINTALGLDSSTDLTKYDPLKQSTDANATTESKALALKIQAAAAQVNTIVSQSAAVLAGTGASSSENAGIRSAYSALADSFAAAAASAGQSTDPTDSNAPVSDGKIDLSSSTTISLVVKSAATKSGATAGTQAKVDALADDTATVVTNLTKSIGDAVTNGGDDVIAVLNKIASIQVVAEDLENDLIEGAISGSVANSVTSTTGDTLTTSVNDAQGSIGDVDGDGQSNAGDSSSDEDTTPATTFTVTETGGAVTFGGTATGNITVAWAGTVGDSVATFTRGSINATTKPDFNGTANKITVASGEVLSVSLSDLTAIAVTTSNTIDGAGSVKLTDTTVAVATLNTADGSTTAKIDASGATTLTGTAANLATAIGSAGLTLPDGYAATISGTPSVSNLNTIDGDTTGVVTATLGTDTLANLNALSGTGNAYTMTVSDASVAAATINTLDGKTTATVTVNAGTITGTSADILTALNSSGLTTSGSINATVNSGTPTISNLNSIRGKTTGTITATLSDTAANLATLTSNANNAYTLTVSDASVTAANLKTIDALTSVAVNTNSNVTTISGSAADINTVATASGITKPASYTASITDSGTWSTTAAVVNGLTVNGGSLTVNASADAAATLAGSTNVTVTGLINDLTATSVTGSLAVTAASDAAMSVATGSGSNTITATALTDGQVLTVTGDDNATISLNGGDLTASGSSGVLTITAGSGTSVITAGSGGDTITAGDGADSLTPGGGADTIKWAASSASALATETGAATGDTDFSAGTAGDLISGFVSGSDKLQFSAAVLANATGTLTDTLVSITSGGVVPNTARFVEVTTALGAETTGDAITLLNGLDTSAVAVGDSFIAFVHGSTNGYLYLVKQVSVSNTIAAQDVTLIGQLAGVTDIANGDLQSAASVTATVNPASTLTIAGDPAGLVEVDLTQATAANVVKQNSEAVSLTETATYNQASVTTLTASSLTGSSGINVTIQASDAGDLSSFTAPTNGTATLILSDSGNYGSQSITNFDQVNLASGINATVTAAAANIINAAPGTNTVTVSDASTSITGKSAVENYTLSGAGANTITIAAAGQNVTTAAHASAQGIKTGSLTTYTGTITGNATDTSTTLTIDTNNTDISGATLNIGASTGVDVLAQGTNGVTVSSAQHDSLIGVSATAAITGTGTVTIDTADTTITADASPSAYILTGAGANTITIAAAGQNVTTAVNASAQEIKTGSLTTYTGTITGNATDTSTTLTIDTNNTDISGATLNIGASTGVDVLAQGTNGVTVSSAQHDSLIGVSATAAITGTGTVTIDTADTTITADASPSAYILTGAGANTITIAAAGQNVTTAVNASAQEIKTGSLTTYTGTITGNATDTSTTLTIDTNNTDISGAVLNIGASTGVDVLAQGTNGVTVSSAQHDSLIGVSATAAITGTGTVTIDTADTTITADASPSAYILTGAGANTITIAAAGQSVTTAVNASAQEIKTGSLTTYTGTITGNATDTSTTLTIDTNNTDISGATLNIGASTGVDVLAQGTNGVTVSSAQHDSLISVSATAAITGTGTVTIDTADTTITADASPSAYILTGAGANTITIAAAGQSVTTAVNASSQTVELGSLTTFSGTFTGNATATDILSITTTGTNISSATLTSVEQINLASGINATMEAADSALVNTAAGTNTVTISDASTSITSAAAIENYTLAGAGANTITLTAAGQSVTTAANASAQGIKTGSLTTYTGTITGNATDTSTTLTIDTNNTDISGAALNIGASTGVDVLAQGTNGVTVSSAQHDSLIGVSATAAITGTGTVTIDTADTTITADASPSAYILTGAGANTITIAAAGQNVTTAVNASAQEIKTGSLTTYTGTITGNATDTSTTLTIDTNNTDISGAALNIGASTGVDVLAQGTNGVTVSSAQHDSLIGVSATAAITGTGTVTIDTADTTITADASPSAYILTGAGANTITIAAAGQNVTTAVNASAQEIKTGSLTTYTGTITGNATDTSTTLTIDTNNTDISGAALNIGASTGVDVLAQGTNGVTVSSAQHDSLIGVSSTAAITGTGTVTIDTADTTITADASPSAYILTGAGANTITIAAAGQNVTTAVNASAQEIKTGSLTTYTGTITGNATDTSTTLTIDTNNTDISGAVLNIGASTGVDVLAQGTNGVTVSSAQHDSLIGVSATAAITGTGTVTIDTADITITADASPSAYILTGAGANTITLGAAGQNITTASHASSQTVELGSLTTFSGTFTGNATATDILSITTTGTNISSATLTSVEQINLASGINATMEAADSALVNTAAGTNTVTISDASTSITSAAAIENYTLAGAGANTITLTAAGQSVTTAANASAQGIKTGSLTTYTGTITGNATDTSTTLTIDTNNTDISGAALNIGASTGVDVLAQGTNGVTVSSAQHDSLIGVSATAAITGTGTVTIDTADITITADASPSAYILTGAGANTITIAAAGQNVTTAVNASSQTVELGSLTTFSGTITGNATATDILSITTTGTNISSATLTSVEQINLASGINATMEAADVALINTAAGTNSVTLSDAITGAATLDAAIETFVLAAGTNSATVGAANQTVNADALTDAQVLTLAGSAAASVSLVAGDLSAGSSSGALTVTATTGSNVITTGSGNDTITGGAGADSITTGTGTDTVVFASSAANNGADTISDFTTGSDKLDFNAFETAGSTVALTGALTTTAGTVYYLTGSAAGNADSAAAAASALTAAVTWSNANVTAWVVISDDNSAAVYEWTDTSGAGVAEGELTLVGTITGTVAAGDLVIA